MSQKGLYSRQTRLIHLASAPCDEQHPVASVSQPIMRTSTVRFHSVQQLLETQSKKSQGERVSTYGRYGLPNRDGLEDIFCELEGGDRAFLAPSGLSAITSALFSLLKQGDHLICSDGVYGPVRYFSQQMLSRYGVEVEYIDLRDPSLLKKHIKSNTKGLYLEVPTSLLLQMHDLPVLANVAHENGLWVMADNSWGSGVAYRPLELGADISVIAGTKYVNGHSDLLLGAAVTHRQDFAHLLDLGFYALGTSVSADDAWLVARGSRTLPLRMKQQAENAMQVIMAIENISEIKRIFHPAYPKDPGHELWKRDCVGSNGLMSIELDLTSEQMKVFVNSLVLFGIGFSWGGYESLVQWVEPSALKLHSYWNNSPYQVARLHIGLESPEDIIKDIVQALSKAKGV